MMNTKTELSWWVPLSFQLAEAKRELPRIFPQVAILRMVLAVIAAVGIASYYLPMRIPNLEFDWIRALFECLACLFALLALCCFIVLIPPFVYVSAEKIVVYQGQSSTDFPYTELDDLRIEDQDTCPVLVLRRRGQPSARKFGISAKVDLNDLQASLDLHKPRR